MSSPNNLSFKEDVDDIWNSYRQKPEIELRNQLIDFYMGKTQLLAGKMYKSRYSNIADYNDYLHFGVLGLISAIDKYKPSSEAQFFTYASYRIKGSIIDGIASMEEKSAAEANSIMLQNRLESISGEMDEPEDLFDDLVETSVMLAIGVILEGDYETESFQYSNRSFQELKEILSDHVDQLDKPYRWIIQYHYYHHLSFVTIAELLEVTKSRVSQLHKSALQQLRAQCSSTLDLKV